MSDEEKNKTPEEILKDAKKYPERAADEDEKKVPMAGVYGGPDAPEMAAVYMGPPDPDSIQMQMAYMGPVVNQQPSMLMAYAGPGFISGFPINGLEHIDMRKGYTPDPQSKFCENCGAKNPKDGKFCTECGEKFKQ